MLEDPAIRVYSLSPKKGKKQKKKKRRILVPLLTVCLQLAAFCNRLQILHWQSVNLSSEARDE